MAGRVYEKDAAGIRRVLQSADCLECMLFFAKKYSGDAQMRPFIGYDRAIVFLGEKPDKKKEFENDRG